MPMTTRMSCPAPAAATPPGAPSPNWQATNRDRGLRPRCPDGSGGKASISSCFYLLVKYTEVTPKSFICKGDAGTTEFKLSELAAATAANFELIDAWDFGPLADAYKHCSYSYHLPFGHVRSDGLERAGLCRGRRPEPVPRSALPRPRETSADFKPDLRLPATAAPPSRPSRATPLPTSWKART